MEGVRALRTACPPGVQIQVRRVELRGAATLFCCWLVKGLLQGRLDSATHTRLLLANLPSSSHHEDEQPGPGLGEVGPHACALSGLQG